MANFKTGWIKKLVNGVSEKIFAIAHVKTVYYDYANKKTLSDKLDEIDKKIDESVTKDTVTDALGYTPYTPNEIDNKFSTLETNIDWKEAVATYNDIATTYPNPEDGWTVNVKDTDYTYRYNGTDWVAISANAIPKATSSVDGLMSSSDKSKLDGIAVGTDGCLYSGGKKTSVEGHTHNYANKSIYEDTTINVGRRAGTTVGLYSTAEGVDTEASGYCSHAEGNDTIAKGSYSHAEGSGTYAHEDYSHAEGNGTAAFGFCSHAEGNETEVLGNYSHAEGNETTAYGEYSHAEGNNTEALTNQHVQGHFNNTNTATSNSTDGTSRGTAFVIGNGILYSNSNAFRVTGEGKVYATNTSISSGADYAEYFEWSDENPNNEDRVGYFVTFDEDNEEKIRIANKDDYILGIISGQPCLLGNGDEDWKKRYILDDFGRYIQETFEYEVKEVDKETGEEITVTKTGTKWKENPDYDQTKPYIPRDQRQEWSAVGMLGVLSVYDDGTCKANGYCKCADGGIATASENGYRVIKRVTDNIVKILVK